tara:strand:+ start:319 stop:924 length:606 start_codon:yes stop_codon:yes gene_type:complete
MTTPTKNKNINEAFVAAQKLIGGARKSSTNPHFKSKYADLSECFNACSDILNEHDIHISQPTMKEDDLFIVRTILTHVSGETMQDFGVPIVGWQGAKNPAQAFGSGQTYARRYSLTSMVGICPADDDGQSLTQDAPPKSDKISAEQAVQLNDLATEVGADKAKYLAYIGVTSFEEINLKQFNVAVSVLEKKRKKLSDKKGT